MGFPPLLATKSDYPLLFKDVKFFENLVEELNLFPGLSFPPGG
jgi:hypothetical protein